MKFHRIDRTAEPTNLHRLASEGGQWILSLDQKLFGVRANLSHQACRGVYLVSYCCGANLLTIRLVLGAMMVALEKFPEEARPSETAQLFPHQTVKPMANDSECWAALLHLAGADLAVIDLAAVERMNQHINLPPLADELFAPATSPAESEQHDRHAIQNDSGRGLRQGAGIREGDRGGPGIRRR